MSLHHVGKGRGRKDRRETSILTSKVIGIAYEIGPKVIEGYADGSSKVLVKKFYKEFPALEGVNFFCSSLTYALLRLMKYWMVRFA